MGNWLEAFGDTLLTGSAMAGRARAEKRLEEERALAQKMQNLQHSILQGNQHRQAALDVLSAGPNAVIDAPGAETVRKGGFGSRLAPVMEFGAEVDPNLGTPPVIASPNRERILPTMEEQRAIDAEARATQMHGLQVGDLTAAAGERTKRDQLRALISLPEYWSQSPEKRQVLWTQAGYSGQAPLTNEELTDRLEIEHNLKLKEINAQGAWNEKIANVRGNSLTAGQEFSATMRLRTNYRKETEIAREVMRQYQLMQEGMAAAERGDLNAGSQAILVTFQKILDPESVVRESEYARSPQGVALLSRLEGLFLKIQQGGPGVPLEDLRTFNRLAQRFVQQASQSADVAKETAVRLSQRYGIDPRDIVDDAPDPNAGRQTQPGVTETNAPPVGQPAPPGRVIYDINGNPIRSPQ